MLVIPIYNILVLPNTEVFLPDVFIKDMNLDKEEILGRKIVFIIAKTNSKSASNKGFYKLGVLGEIKFVNEAGFVVIKTLNRVSIDKLNIKGNNIEIFATDKLENNDLDEIKEKERFNVIRKKLVAHFSKYSFGIFTHEFFENDNSLSELMVVLSPFIKISVKEKYDLLKENSLTKRNNIIEKIIYEYLEVAKVKNEAQEMTEKDNQKVYREMAIKKQMNYLQKELDKIHPENTGDYDKFKNLIKTCGIKGEALKEANCKYDIFLLANKEKIHLSYWGNYFLPVHVIRKEKKLYLLDTSTQNLYRVSQEMLEIDYEFITNLREDRGGEVRS